MALSCPRRGPSSSASGTSAGRACTTDMRERVGFLAALVAAALLSALLFMPRFRVQFDEPGADAGSPDAAHGAAPGLPALPPPNAAAAASASAAAPAEVAPPAYVRVDPASAE